MGFSTDAHCFACGYDTALRLGGGMSNHATYAAWPVICQTCSAVTTANYKQASLICEQCELGNVISVTDPRATAGDGEVVEQWGFGRDCLTLTNGHYRCPKCNATELRFGTNVGLHSLISWD